jgi:hypothetical protein
MHALQDVTKTRDGKPVTTVFKGFQRDMPLSYEHQMENLCDPVRQIWHLWPWHFLCMRLPVAFR